MNLAGFHRWVQHTEITTAALAVGLGVVALILFQLIRRTNAMNISLDALNAQVTALESVVTTAAQQLGSAAPGGATQADVDAITARVGAAVTTLTGATQPK